jgi:hypothetical protein
MGALSERERNLVGTGKARSRARRLLESNALASLVSVVKHLR